MDGGGSAVTLPPQQPVFCIDKINKADVKEDDKIIVILGPTGAGKSNFIQKLASKDLDISSDGSQRGTNELLLYRMYGHPIWNDHIVLADTPGFRDATLSEYSAVKAIREWIKTYKVPRLHTLFYFDDISSVTKGGDPDCWKLFTSLCGEAQIRASLVTTNWDRVAGWDERSAARLNLAAEKKRRELLEYWKSYLDRGIQFFKFENTATSATGILDDALNRHISPVPFLLEDARVSLKRPPVEEYVFRLLSERFGGVAQRVTTSALDLERFRDQATELEVNRLQRLRVDFKTLKGEMWEFDAGRWVLVKLFFVELPSTVISVMKIRRRITPRPSPKHEAPNKTFPTSPKTPDNIPGTDPNESIEHLPDLHSLADVMNWYLRRRPGGTRQDGNIVFLVVGVTGAGKSSFINSCIKLGSSARGPALVGHELRAGTTKVVPFPIDVPKADGQLVLVDTPGFDDPGRSNADVLQEIAKYLANSYRQNVLFDGIIYLHPITSIRFDAGAGVMLHISRKIYGEDRGYSHLALVSSWWDNVPPSQISRYEANDQERKATHWAGFLHEPDSAYTGRYDPTTDETETTSVVDVISGLLRQSTKTELRLKLQRELVDENIALPRTQAGRAAFTLSETAKYYLRQLEEVDAGSR